jgi:hypothetical protein
MRFFYQIDMQDTALIDFLAQRESDYFDERPCVIFENLQQRFGDPVRELIRLPVRIKSHQMEQVLDKLEMNMQKIETLTEEEKELPKEMFIALSGEPELVDVSKLFQAMKKLGDVTPGTEENIALLEEESMFCNQTQVNDLILRVEEALGKG